MQANRYMRVATEYPNLIENVTSRLHLPSIKSAIALLSAPEETQSEIKEELEAGRYAGQDSRGYTRRVRSARRGS